MPGSCSICANPARPAIDDALISGRSYRDIEAQHGVTISSLSRHRKSHVSVALKAVALEREQSGATSALERFEELLGEARAVLMAMKADGNASKSLQAVQVMAGVVEKIARITGELDDRPQVAVVNVQQSADWLALRSAILGALEPHSAARADVLAAISGAGKSMVSAIAALHCALYHPGSLVLIFGPTQRQAQELFRVITRWYGSLGRPVGVTRRT